MDCRENGRGKGGYIWKPTRTNWHHDPFHQQQKWLRFHHQKANGHLKGIHRLKTTDKGEKQEGARSETTRNATTLKKELEDNE